MIEIILSLSLSAQGGGHYPILHEYLGSNGVGLGRSVAKLDDFDGDGISEFAIGVPGEDAPGYHSNPGAVYVYSGDTFAPRYILYATNSGQRFGHDVAPAGDLDGDGVGDILVGTEGTNGLSALAFSGIDGSLLYQITDGTTSEHFGTTVSALDDVNHDGYDDFLVAAPGDGPGGGAIGTVSLYSGKTGTLIYRVAGRTDFDWFGIAMSAIEDQDGDGVKDFLVGAPSSDPWPQGGPVKTGEICGFSGATGNPLFRLLGPSRRGYFGGSISTAGDLNGDGISDLAIGAPGWYGTVVGEVFLYSGLDHSLLGRIPGTEQGDYFGWTVVITPDLNQDGRMDLLVGQISSNPDGMTSAGSVHLYSGASQDLIQTWDGPSAEARLGNDIAMIGDVTGNGVEEWLCGAFGIRVGGSNNGGAFIYSFDALLHADASEISGSSGGVMTLELDFPPEEANQQYQILISTLGPGVTELPGAEIPLDADDVFWRTIRGVHPPALNGGIGMLDAQGDAIATFTVPTNSPSAVWHTSRWFSAITIDRSAQSVRMVSVPLPLAITP